MVSKVNLLKCHLKHLINAYNAKLMGIRPLPDACGFNRKRDRYKTNYAIRALASMYYCVNLPIGRKVDAVDLLQMTLQKHHTATSPQVPDTAKCIQTTAGKRQQKRKNAMWM